MTTRLLISKALTAAVVCSTLIAKQQYPENPSIEFAFDATGMLLVSAAALGRAWSAVFVSGRKSVELITDGPYSIVRNPLYFFSFLGFIGVGLLLQSFIRAAALTVIFFLTHWPTILREETKLRGIFGEPFDDYLKSVPRFIPRLSLYRCRDTAEFAPKVFTKAVLESMMLLAVIPLTEALELLRKSDILPALLPMY